MNSRASQRRRKNKMNVWVKVLIIIALFFVAGIGGYLVGGLPSKQSNMTTSEVATSDSSKEKDNKTKIKVNQQVKLSSGLTIRFTQLETYPHIDGPNCPIGIVAEVENTTSKKKELPYKYLMNLTVGKKQASSVGIYSYTSVQSGGELVAYTAKLNAGESAKVVYLFSMSDKNTWKNSKSGTLLMKDNGKEYQLVMPISHQSGEDEYVTTSSSAVTQSSDVNTQEVVDNQTDTTPSVEVQDNTNQSQYVEQSNQLTNQSVATSTDQVVQNNQQNNQMMDQNNGQGVATDNGAQVIQ